MSLIDREKKAPWTPHVTHHRTCEKADGYAERTDCGLATTEVESTQDWSAVDCAECERMPEGG